MIYSSIRYQTDKTLQGSFIWDKSVIKHTSGYKINLSPRLALKSAIPIVNHPPVHICKPQLRTPSQGSQLTA